MASTTGFYIHPYYCFRKDADSNYGFTCGFDTGAVAAVAAAAEIPHRAHVPAIVARTFGPADPLTGTAEVTAHPGAPEVTEIVHVPEVFATVTSAAVQYDLPGIFQGRIPGWTKHLWVGMTKGKVFKPNTNEYNILHQNPGDGYAALYQILSSSHPTLSPFPSLSIRSPPVQIATETVTMYYQHYIDYIHLRCFLENNRSTLNISSELDKFISGLTHSKEIFHISREERNSNDPTMQRKFTQGAIVSTIALYLIESKLIDGKPSTSHSQYDDSDSDADFQRRSTPSRFSGLRDSARTTSLSRSAPSPSKKKKKKTTTRRTNVFQVDINNPLASLIVPDGLQQHEVLRVKMYESGLKQVTRDAAKFTDGMNCAVCGKQHTFDKCPILMNIPLLKKHFINYCIQMNKTQKLMVASIHSIDANWGVIDINNDDDDDDDDSSETTDNDADFQGEEE